MFRQQSESYLLLHFQTKCLQLEETTKVSVISDLSDNWYYHRYPTLFILFGFLFSFASFYTLNIY